MFYEVKMANYVDCYFQYRETILFSTVDFTVPGRTANSTHLTVEGSVRHLQYEDHLCIVRI